MGLESPTYVSDLVPTNPVSTDLRSQGDDHLRNLKTALQNTFPNADIPFYFPTATVKTADFVVSSTDLNKTFYITTSAPATSLNVTLPSLTASNDGWFCTFVKTNSQTTPYFVNPASGTVQSGDQTGLSRTRRSIPGKPCKAMWTGSAWVIERALGVPLGHVMKQHTTSLPVGYEWANGQTLSSSTLYPEFFVANGNSLVLADFGGRAGVGRETMGGVASVSRVTSAGSGITGSTLGATGGTETHTLTVSQLPAHQHGGITSSDGAHTHSVAYIVAGADDAAGGIPQVQSITATGTTSNQGSALSGGAHSHVVASEGSGLAHLNMMPIIITNMIVVVE